MRTFNAVGVHIFAGGFSLGVQAAGFRLRANLETLTVIDDYLATAHTLFPALPIWKDRNTWPLRTLRAEGVDLVYANPPCAIWSVAGASMRQGKSSWRRDKRTQCIHDVMNVLRAVQPTVLCWESVTQAWTRGRGLVEELAKEGQALGYAVTVLFTSAELHGVPQPRYRFVMFFHKVHLDFPTPTTPLRDVRDVLGLERLEDGRWSQRCPVWGEPTTHRGYFFMMASMRPREGMRDMCVEEGWSENPAFMAHRLSLDGRGKTLTSAVMEVHPVFPRWIANSECAALGGWPLDERLYVGDTSSVRAQLCQAVLPPVGEYLGRCVRAGLENEIPPQQGGGIRVISHISDERPGLR